MFEINSSTRIILSFPETEAIMEAIERFHRDMSFTLFSSGRKETVICITEDRTIEAEGWEMDGAAATLMIRTSDELGVIYALAEVSRLGLGIKPLWYWCNQDFVKEAYRILPITHAESQRQAFRYRGWFINDEVLFLHWRPNGSETEQWEMAFEALIRLGGNLVIPGTDRSSRKFAPIASRMGLWITHHHAEPLGAEMFSRAFPGIEPSYDSHAELYEKLWEEAVDRQKEMKVIWTLGFRGQGDKAFWKDDPRYDTDEKRAALISSIMAKQAEIVRRYVPSPVFGCNIYSEAALYYRKGLLDIPEGAIRIFADNGYGAMVSRREWDSDPRIPALPKEEDREQPNGMYYHASFYDLQAANHITATPVSMETIASELDNAYIHGIRDAIILNVSNVRPHIAAIHAVSMFWQNGNLDHDEALRQFATRYFSDDPERVASFYKAYSDAAIQYGRYSDSRGGDQYLTYPVRMLTAAWMRSEWEGTHEYGFAFSSTLDDQMAHYREEAGAALPRYEALLDGIISSSPSKLLMDTLGTYARWYIEACEAVLEFTDSYISFRSGRMAEAFIHAGKAADCYAAATAALHSWEAGKWKGFYSGDALTDTASMIRLMKALMDWIRILGEGPYFYQWHRLFTYSDEDRDVTLITNYEPRMSSYELYSRWKEREDRTGV